MPEKSMISRRDFLRGASAASALAAAGGMGLWYANKVEPERLSVEHVMLQLPRLDPAFHGYRLVQISDIHMDHRFMTADRLKGIAAVVNAQQPDYVVITGDFVTRGNAALYCSSIAQGLSVLSARDGVGSVMGNHDYWVDVRAVKETLNSVGVHDLNNRVHTLTRGGTQFHIAGVDDVWERKHRLDRVLDALPAEGAAVLLAHEPDFADESAASERFDLQVSGHSHGGQCVMPGGFKPILPSLGHKYPSGLYQVGDMWQYTNRGLGMGWFPQVRFNCTPEITVFTLTMRQHS